MVIVDFDDVNRLEMALTNGCKQCGWGAKYYFPCSPKEIREAPLDEYFQRLKVGAIFAYHDDAPKLIITEFVKIKNNSSILIMCEREGDWREREGFHPWLISEIMFKSGLFIHYKGKLFFEKDEADQEFCTQQGRHEVTEVF
jgi:hypothetical protein